MLQATLSRAPEVPTAPVRARALRLPAGAAALLVLGALLMPLLPASVADPVSPVSTPVHASSTQQPAVAARTDPSVPDASAVFRGRDTPATEPAPTF